MKFGMQQRSAFQITHRRALDRGFALECAVELKYFIALGFGKTADLPPGDLLVVRVRLFAVGVLSQDRRRPGGKPEREFLIRMVKPAQKGRMVYK